MLAEIAQDLSRAQAIDRVSTIELSRAFGSFQFITLIYDYLLTFSQEVQLVWRSPLGSIKLAFLLNRYLLFANMILQQFILGTLHTDIDSLQFDCPRLGITFSMMSLATQFISDVILCLRLWVMWGNDRRVLTGLISLFVGITIFQAIFAARSYINNVYVTVGYEALPRPWIGCTFQSTFDGSYILFIMYLVPDALLLVMALIPTIKLYLDSPGLMAFRHLGRGGIMYDVHREGVLFYFYECVISAICMILVAIQIIPCNSDDLIDENGPSYACTV
ncbi:hypothetical protein NP233_g11833 [Leucocoprinus birnbaumii]|uniref:DUF6533 domain-containing protein n=1 Tax=Leucocoprinus birnbaumii TaxID=56174 RepID=A0AAD5YK04_9AGAR|nr:hypothetical protein NP233_g11833 [Leucocoprinus birnbaumii]